MRYLASALKAEIIIIWLLMMYFNQVITSPPFMSGVAIATIGIYLVLQGMFGEQFTTCIFKKMQVPKKKWFFG